MSGNLQIRTPPTHFPTEGQALPIPKEKHVAKHEVFKGIYPKKCHQKKKKPAEPKKRPQREVTNPKHPITFSDDDWGVESPPEKGI